MKLVGAISTAVLSLTLGVGIQAYAQQDQHEQQEDKDKAAQEKEKKTQPKTPVKQDDKKAQQEDKNTKSQEKQAQEQHAQEAKPGKQDEQARGNGGRIPEDRYKAHFGQEHHFRVSQAEYGNRRFQYGGYWFGFESAWPSNWLYTQDVYVIEIDGVYYLCNANYPGVNVTLSVTL